MSYLSNLPEDVAILIWRDVFSHECLPHIKTQAHKHYYRQFEFYHKKEQEERNQYKSYINSRGNMMIERVPYIPNSQTGKYREYQSFAFELKFPELVEPLKEVIEVCKNITFC